MLYCYLLITLYRTLMYVSSVFMIFFIIFVYYSVLNYSFYKLLCNKKAPLTMLLGRFGYTIEIMMIVIIKIEQKNNLQTLSRLKRLFLLSHRLLNALLNKDNLFNDY